MEYNTLKGEMKNVKQEIQNDVKKIEGDLKDKITIPFYRSLSMKITGFVVIAVIITATLMMGIMIPLMEQSSLDVVQSYLEDEAKMSATLLDNSSALQGDEMTLSVDYLTATLEDVKISDYASSYAYVVDADGTMLYHPTADKIGSAVSNAAIKEVVTNLQSGKTVTNGYVVYDYEGIDKYAAYSIACDQQCIIVITADETDVLASVNALRIQIIIVSIIADLVMAIIVIFVSKKLMNPVVKITQAIYQLSYLKLGVDNYTHKMKKRKDEIGYMSRGVISLNDNLLRFVEEIREQSGTLYATSEKLAQNAEDTVNTVKQVELAVNEVAIGAGDQAEETTQATSNVIVMGDMIEATNLQVENLKSSSKEIENAADQAVEILEELLKINEKASESIDVIYDRTNTTNKSVEEIKKAISIITSIAEETNLLSLNASIEAARAGEHGRGFAIVAAQISKLAEQSNTSAKQIEAITEKLIVDSTQAVNGMQDVKVIMVEQTEHVKSTNQAFDKVKENIDVTVLGLTEISHKTEELDKTRQTVTDTVQNLSAIAEENAASSQESSASVTEVCTIMEKVTSDTVLLKDISKVIDKQLHEFQI